MEKSLLVVVSARDQASGPLETMHQNMARAAQAAQNQLYALTHTGYQTDIREAEQAGAQRLAQNEALQQKLLEKEQAAQDKIREYRAGRGSKRAIGSEIQPLRAELASVQSLRAEAAQQSVLIQEVAAARRVAITRSEQERVGAQEAAFVEERAATQQRLDRTVFDSTHNLRERQLRDADEYYAALREKYAGDAAMQAKINEASAAQRGQIMGAQGDPNTLAAGFKSLIPQIGAATMALAAVRLGIGAIGVAFAEVKLGKAIDSGGFVEIARAQLAVKDAQTDMMVGIPLLGRVISSAMRRFGDREGVEQAIRNIQEIEQRTKQFHEATRKMMQDTALRQAELDGKTEEEKMRLRRGITEQDRANEVAARRMNMGAAKQEVLDAEARLAKMKESYRKAGTGSGEYGGRTIGEAFNPLNYIGDASAKDIEAAERALVDLRLKQRAADNEYAAAQKARASDAETARNEQAAQAQRDADKARQEAKERSDITFEVEQAQRRAAGNNTEAEVADIRRKFELEREKIKAAAGMDEKERQRLIGLSSETEKAELSKLFQSETPERRTQDLGVLQSQRFLKSATGQAAPAWVEKQIAEAQKQTELLKTIAAKAGITLEEVGAPA